MCGREEMHPAESRGVANGFRVEPAKKKAELATLVAVPLIEVCAENLCQRTAAIEKVDEKELTLVMGISAVENECSPNGEDEKCEKPEESFGD